jgi:hypothetical protein
VAKYDRIPGPLRANVHEPAHRQPVCERWLITQAAFKSIEERLGALRQRVEFTVHPFNE